MAAFQTLSRALFVCLVLLFGTAPAWAVVKVTLETPAEGEAAVQPFTISGWTIDKDATSGTGIDIVHSWIWPTACDGTATFLGYATYGGSRPDVAALEGSQFQNSGFTLSVPSGISAGAYCLRVYAHSSVSDTWHWEDNLITVESAAAVVLEKPLTSQSSVLPMTLEGWAIDTRGSSGTGVDIVSIWACLTTCTGSNSIHLGLATYGGARPKVAIQQGSRFTNSGFTLSVGGLSAGTYVVILQAHSTVDDTWHTRVTSMQVTINIVMQAEAHGVSGTVAQPFVLSGLAGDTTFTGSHPGIETVHLYACYQTCTGSNAVFLGEPNFGEERTTRPSALQNARYLNSGFSQVIYGLATGPYYFLAFAKSSERDEWRLVVTYVNVIAPPLLTITAPNNNIAIGQPFNVQGWAIDLAASSGTGVSQVQLSSYLNPGSGTPVEYWGATTYGGSRSDVATLYGSQFLNSGFTKTFTGKPSGQYQLDLYANSSVSDVWVASHRSVFVDMPTVSLTIDRPGAGTGAVTATGLSCAGGSQTQQTSCSATYAPFSVVTLTAVPDTASTFTGWGGACSGTSTCQVTLDVSRYVTATFAPNPNLVELAYYHTDTLGSVRMLTSDTGTVLARYDYHPFGEDSQPLTGNPLRFTGQELDKESALYYFGARYYRNTTGRFTSVDPLMDAGSAMLDPQHWNRYAYVLNNPLNLIDPFGLQSCKSGPDSMACVEDVAVGGDAVWELIEYCDAFCQIATGVASTAGPLANVASTAVVVAIVGSQFVYPVAGAAAQCVVLGCSRGDLMVAALPVGIGKISVLKAASVTAARAAAPAVQEGTMVYRVFGGEARGLGQSWTTVNPGTVGNFREAAGLFPGNTGQFLAIGRLQSTEGVMLRQALPGPGGVGGTIPELLIPNAGRQVCLLGVCGVNPGF